MTSNSDMDGHRSRKTTRQHPFTQARRDLGRAIPRNVPSLDRELLEPARAHLRELRVGGDEYGLDVGGELAVHGGERDLTLDVRAATNAAYQVTGSELARQ